MAFMTSGNAQTSGSDQTPRRQVDYKAMNQHVIDAANTQAKPRSLPGTITGIYDLGLQELQDAAIQITDAEWLKRVAPFDGDVTGADAQRIIADSKREDARFEMFEGNMCFRYKQKPVQQIAIAADFPQIMVDKGQFITGESKPMPLRLILNGEFNRLVQRPYNLRSMNHNQGKPGAAKWALAKNNGIHKLAEAAGLLDADGLFKAERIDELLGKTVQFQIQVFNNSKGFYTERINLAGMVPEGLPIPELPADVTLALVQMWDTNLDKNAALEARASIKNHQRKALNFTREEQGVVTDSPLKAVIGEGYKPQGDKPAEPVQKPEVTPILQKEDEFDEDIPF